MRQFVQAASRGRSGAAAFYSWFYVPQPKIFLEEVDEDYCQCPFGAAGKEVGSWDQRRLLRAIMQLISQLLPATHP